MTSRPKPYCPPKHVVSLPRDDHDDVFSARPSTLPKHVRLAMSPNTPSPPPSHQSGRTTPALSSGSSASSQSSRSSQSSSRSRQSIPQSSPLVERTQRRSQPSLSSHRFCGTKLVAVS
ncbi:hypothetical protein B0H19DRAFT_1273742 [Mycena capillaripes]|nr:hypothetical protein B0H19DRAFT_1273742 [Mycena capillaripes]